MSSTIMSAAASTSSAWVVRSAIMYARERRFTGGRSERIDELAHFLGCRAYAMHRTAAAAPPPVNAESVHLMDSRSRSPPRTATARPTWTMASKPVPTLTAHELPLFETRFRCVRRFSADPSGDPQRAAWGTLGPSLTTRLRVRRSSSLQAALSRSLMQPREVRVVAQEEVSATMTQTGSSASVRGGRRPPTSGRCSSCSSRAGEIFEALGAPARPTIAALSVALVPGTAAFLDSGTAARELCTSS
jgi:hypothetical protein